MVRTTTILLRQLPALTSKHVFNTPAIYSLGISYAGKDSPPFISPGQPPSKAGFAHVGHDKRAAWGIRDWVNESLSIRAGRGELDKGSKGGWKDDMADQVGRWGAGEDFFAIDEFRMSQGDLPSTVPHLTHLAISDGVGGWSDTVDPSFFSQALMYHYSMTARQALGSDQADSGSYTSPYSNPHRSEKITNNGQASSGSENQPLEFLAKAYELLEKDGNVVAGGATACAVSLDKKGQLQGVNLGDSGCTILRDGQIIFTTPSLTHYFNCPKQLSKIPKHMAGQGVIRDKPRTSSDTFTAQLQPGDIILLYTDGLCDNVPAAHFPLLLQRIKVLLAHPDNAHLSPLDRSRELARLYADVLVAYGRMAMTRTGEELEEVKDDKGEVTVRKSWRTPFEVEAAKEGMRYLGGKVDDITVIAAVVDELNPEDE